MSRLLTISEIFVDFAGIMAKEFGHIPVSITLPVRTFAEFRRETCAYGGLDDVDQESIGFMTAYGKILIKQDKE